MKKIIHGIFGDSSDEKKHHEEHQVHHGHPEDLTGIQLNNQPIQSMGDMHKAGELHGVPLTYGPMNLHTHSLLPPSSLRSPSDKSPVHFESEVHQHTPWLQLHTLDNAVELMVQHLKVLDQDVDMAFKSLGMARQKDRQHDQDHSQLLHDHDGLAERRRLGEQEQKHHEEFSMDWTNENSHYRIKIPMGYNVNPEHIHVTMEDRVLIVKYKNALDTATGHMEEQLIKKIPMPEAVDAKKLRVMFKPEGYLLIEGPELQGSHQPHFASAAGESVKRDYADAVSQGAKKLRDDQPTVTPRLNETQRTTKSFEQETTNVTNVSHPRVSEAGSQLGHVMEPRGPYIQETARPAHHEQHMVHQTHHQQTQPLNQPPQHLNQPPQHFNQPTQHLYQQTQPMVQQVQTVHGRFEGPLDTSAFASIQPSAGYMAERSSYDQMRHDVNRGADQMQHKAEDVKHQAGQKWEETKDTVADKWEHTKDKAADLTEKAGDKLHDAKESVKESFHDTKEKAAELTDKAGHKLHDAKESVKETLHDTKEGIKEGWETTKEKVSDLADKAGDKLVAAKDKIAEGWEKTKDKVSEVAHETGDKLEAAKDTVVDKTKAGYDKVADALTPDEKPEHHEVRRQEVHRPGLQQQPIQQHVRIEQEYEYTKPVNQPAHGRVETHVQQRQQQAPLNQGLHRQQVQQSVQHGHVEQPQLHRQQRVQPHGRSEQHVTEKHQQQPLRQNVNIERQAMQTQQQPMGRRRSDETHLTESHRPQHQEQHKLSKTQSAQQGQEVPLVDTAVGRRMSQEDAKKPPSSSIGVEERDWVNKPELRADHINKVGYEDIMKQSVAKSESGTGKTQVHFTPPAEGGRRERPEGVDKTQQLHRDVNRPQPEGHERRVEHTRIQQQHQAAPQRHELHKDVERHEVHKEVHDRHEDQSKLERGLEKVTDKVLGFFGVDVEGGHHKEDVKEQAKQKGQELKNKAGEKVEQAKDKTQELKNRAGQKVDQAKNKAEDIKKEAGQKARDTKEHAGEAWEKTKAKTAEKKDQAGQKITDVKHAAGEKVDQAKNKASELKDRAGDKLEQAKEKTVELKDKAGDKLHDAKEGIKEGWETTKDKASELADKAGDKLVAAKDTIVDTAKAAKDKVADALTPEKRPEHHQQQHLARTQLHQQPIQRSELLQQPLHGQRTHFEKNYEYNRQLGANQQNVNIGNLQMPQPSQQAGVTTHFEKHVEKHRETQAPTGGKIEEHFEHHEVLPGQQQRTGLQQQNIRRTGETAGRKLDQAKESASETLEESKQRGQQMVNKAGEKLHEAKEKASELTDKAGNKLHEAKESVVETLHDTKEKAAELTDKAGNKLHDAKESVKGTLHDTKEKAAELTEKAGNKLHDAKESVKETLHDTKEKAAELTDKAGTKLHDAKESVKETLHDTKEKIADTWEDTKDKAAELKDKAGEKLHDAKETVVEAKDTVADKLTSAKDTVADKLIGAKDSVVDTMTHAKDKVVDFFTPEHHEETHHVQQRAGVRPASHLSSETTLDQRHREDHRGEIYKVRLEGPVTIQGRVVGGEFSSDATTRQGQTIIASGIQGATRGQAATGTHGSRSEQIKSEVKTVPQQQQQQIESRTTKVVHEEKKTVAPGGLLKKGTTTNQSPQAM